MGLIDSTMLAGFGEPDAGLSEYQAEYLKFQRDYPALRGTPALMQRANSLYNMARQSGPVALGHVLSNFRATYGDSPELVMLTNKS